MVSFANRVRVNTSTTGTGTVTLGSATSNAYCTAAEAGISNGATVTYLIEDTFTSGVPADFEIGTGVYTSSGTTLTRATVLLSKISGTSGTTKITLSGSAVVSITAAAEDFTNLYDAELVALAGLTSAADKVPYFTGSGTAALADLSSAMRTFLTTPSSANFAALVSDDSFALNDAELAAIAGLTSAADKFPYFTGSGTAALADLSSAMRTFLTTSSSANLKSVVTDETGSGSLVFATSPTLVTPILGTPTSGDLSNCTGVLHNVVEDTTPQLGGALDTNAFNIQFNTGTGILDNSANEQVLFTTTASAVNYLNVTNSATGNPPIVAAAGGDINANLRLSPKGSGGVLVSAVSSDIVSIDGSSSVFQTTTDSSTPWAQSFVLSQSGTAPVAFAFAKTRGATPGTQGIVSSGDGVGASYYYASDGVGFQNGARLTVKVDGTPGVGDMPMRMEFSTSPDGSASPAVRMTIKNDGGVILGSGTTSPGTGNLRVTNIELGNDTDTTLSRASAGVLAIEGSAAASANNMIGSVGITIDGGGSAITTGVKGYIEVPYACTINRVTMLADQSGSAVVDIWKDTYANYPPTVLDTITAAAKPTITTATKSQDTTLTGWTTSITAGDILGFNVDSASTITRLHVILKVTKS